MRRSESGPPQPFRTLSRVCNALHEPERRTPMRLDGNCFATSRIGVRRSDRVHGPDARPTLEVEALHEQSPGGRTENSPPLQGWDRGIGASSPDGTAESLPLS